MLTVIWNFVVVNEMFRVNKRTKGLTVKIYIILVRTQQQIYGLYKRHLLVFTHKNAAHKKLIKKERRR